MDFLWEGDVWAHLVVRLLNGIAVRREWQQLTGRLQAEFEARPQLWLRRIRWAQLQDVARELQRGRVQLQ